MKKIKQKGVAMVEYAVLLAFVAVVAGVFMDDGGLEKGIQGSVDKILKVFDIGGNKYTSYTFTYQRGWLYDDATGFTQTDGTSDWSKKTNCSEKIPLGDPGTYIFTIDYNAMKEYLASKGIEASESDIKNYVSGISLGIWGEKENGKLATNKFEYNSGEGAGITTTTGGRSGDSGELALSNYVNGQHNYYQLRTTEADGNASVRYSVIHGSIEAATSEKGKAFDSALINAGIIVTKK